MITTLGLTMVNLMSTVYRANDTGSLPLSLPPYGMPGVKMRRPLPNGFSPSGEPR